MRYLRCTVVKCCGWLLLEDVATPSGSSSRRLYSYLSGSDNDAVDDEARHSGRQRRHGDWRTQATGCGDDDDDDGMSSASWVRSGTGSESDPAADDDDVTMAHEAVGNRVYSRINELGLSAHLLSAYVIIDYVIIDVIIVVVSHSLDHRYAFFRLRS